MRFQFKFVALPLIIFLLTAILTAVFYSGLPDEIAWMFAGDGLPSKIGEKSSVIAWIIRLQFIFTLGAFLITCVIALVFRNFVPPDSRSMKPEPIITLMGNMVAVPQFVIFFTMLDIFSYNSYEIHLLPLWLNALIILVASGIILSIFFIRSLLRIRTSNKEK